MKKKKKNASSNNFRWIFFTLIPIITIIIIIQFRRIVMPTNEEIIQYIKNVNSYSTKIEYTIRNSKGNYVEEVEAKYNKGNGMTVIFPDNKIKIYKDEFISINEKNLEYDLNSDSDLLFPLGFINKILEGNISNIDEKTEEWGDIKYLDIDIELDSKNNHMKKIKVYINKGDKTPILIKVFDKDNCEKVTIKFKDFNF